MIDANAKPTKIIRVTNKKNGVTYLYEDQAFWNSCRTHNYSDMSFQKYSE